MTPAGTTLFSRPLCTPVRGQLQHSLESPRTVCGGQCHLPKEVCADADVGQEFDVAGLLLVLTQGSAIVIKFLKFYI